MTATLDTTYLREDFSRARLLRLFEQDSSRVFWRHDVDYDLESAAQMAQLEYEYSIQATYYIRALQSEDGVCLSTPGCRELLQTILRCGHRLGTHVDLQMPRDATVMALQMRKACVEQTTIAAMSGPFGLRVSLHAPPKEALFRVIPGFVNAMEPVWHGKYVSDSRGRFNYFLPEDMLDKEGPIQINLHPEWWFLPPIAARELRIIEEAKP